MNKRVVLGILIFLVEVISYSQIERKGWKDHFSYNNCVDISANEDFVIAATDVGLIIYDKATEAISRYSKVNGLSDVGITALSILNGNDFIVGYSNGNIDLIKNQKVINLPDLKNKNLPGSKRINDFCKFNDLVYCSLDFGILVIDLLKLEVADTYYLGSSNENLVVNQTQVDGGFIYAATGGGLYRGRIGDPTLSYFASWKEISGIKGEVLAFDVLNEDKFFIRRLLNGKYSVVVGNEDHWIDQMTLSSFKSANVSGDLILLSERHRLRVFDFQFVEKEVVDSYFLQNEETITPDFSSALISDDVIYAADIKAGLIKKNPSGFDDALVPNGPYSNHCFAIKANDSYVYTVGGGLTMDYNNLNRGLEYSFLQGGKWSSFKSQRKGNEKNWRDLIRICPDPFDDRKVYMSSWGAGLFEIVDGEIEECYDYQNSSMDLIWAGPAYQRIGGVAADSKGNLWMSVSEVANGIVIKTPGNDWYKFNYQTLNNLHSTDQFLITKDNLIWIIIPFDQIRKGILVIDTNGTPLDQTDDAYRGAISPELEDDPRNAGQLKLWDENGDVITNSIYSVAEDKDGYIWMGTDKGIVVYFRPWSIFNEDYPIASRIKVPLNDGTNSAAYLLDNKKVTSIAVDGANRKWLGTEGAGAYLVSEDGTKTIHAFNITNSPLPSDNISSIAIHPITGEVFIGTEKGIISYKGDAIEPHKTLKKVYAYPNPVRSNYTGPITITGLVLNSNVKITNVSGKLVFETRSLGGQVEWDGRNLWGQKVSSGVYLVYVASEDGSDTQTTKILIVN